MMMIRYSHIKILGETKTPVNIDSNALNYNQIGVNYNRFGVNYNQNGVKYNQIGVNFPDSRTPLSPSER